MNRKIFSPYYDFKAFECRHPYAKAPNSKEKSSRGHKVTTAEEKKARNALHSNEKRSVSESESKVKCFFERGAGDFQDESVEDLTDYQNLDQFNKSCQTPVVVKRRQSVPKRMSSQNFLQLVNKR